MTFCIAVFRSRTQVMEFIEYMQSGGIDCAAINTPVEARIGCGISARFPAVYLNYAKNVVEKLRLNTFRGFFTVNRGIGGVSVRRF